LRGTSALNLNIFPVAGVPTGDLAAEEEEHAAAEEPTRSGVSGPNSAERRSVQYVDDAAVADPEEAGAASRGEGEGARSKSARLDPVRLGMKRSL
jgi:hypothetical protein